MGFILQVCWFLILRFCLWRRRTSKPPLLWKREFLNVLFRQISHVKSLLPKMISFSPSSLISPKTMVPETRKPLLKPGSVVGLPTGGIIWTRLSPPPIRMRCLPWIRSGLKMGPDSTPWPTLALKEVRFLPELSTQLSWPSNVGTNKSLCPSLSKSPQ